MHNDTMGRAEFLKYIVSKTASAASQRAEVLIDPLRRAKDLASQAFGRRILPVDQYSNYPKLLTSSQPPVYIVGEIDKNLTAFHAACERDSFLLSYIPLENAFYCSLCGSKHFLIEEDGRMLTDLPSFSLITKDGFIYITGNG